MKEARFPSYQLQPTSFSSASASTTTTTVSRLQNRSIFFYMAMEGSPVQMQNAVAKLAFCNLRDYLFLALAINDGKFRDMVSRRLCCKETPGSEKIPATDTRYNI